MSKVKAICYKINDTVSFEACILTLFCKTYLIAWGILVAEVIK